MIASGLTSAASSHDQYTLTLQSLEGEATEIRYHLYRE